MTPPHHAPPSPPPLPEPQDKEGTATPAEWAPHSSDNVLRWLLKSATDFWDGAPGQMPNTIARATGPPLNISDCDAAMKFLSAQMDEIDLVGTMDTPEEFAQCTRKLRAPTLDPTRRDE